MKEQTCDRLSVSATKNIGIDEELAHQVSASLDPDHNASKKDVMMLQEAILQLQTRTDERLHQFIIESEKRHHEFKADCDQRYYDLRIDSDKNYHALKEAMVNGFSDIRTEFHNCHSHAIYAFSAILVSIFTVLVVNIYFHL